MIMKKVKKNFGFTLVELLVAISIVGILSGISIFGLTGARESARDGRRKSDLETVRSALELYKADCASYRNGSGNVVSVLGSTFGGGSCNSNTYLENVPNDLLGARYYRYWSNGIRYELCAALEGGTGSVSCGGSSDCGVTCNYRVTSP